LKRTSDVISQEQYQDLCNKVKEILEKHAVNLLRDSKNKEFLQANPFPENQKQTTLKERMYYLLINRIKNWVNKEQIKKDGGVFWKRKFKKNPSEVCAHCRKDFKQGDIIEFHHTLRDGRRPIPVHKPCHDELKNEK